MAKLFEKQRTNFYYNWLSLIEDFWKQFGVLFMGHSVLINKYIINENKSSGMSCISNQDGEVQEREVRRSTGR